MYKELAEYPLSPDSAAAGVSRKRKSLKQRNQPFTPSKEGGICNGVEINRTLSDSDV